MDKYLFKLFNGVALAMISVPCYLLSTFIWTTRFCWSKCSQKMLKVMIICKGQTFNSDKNIHDRNAFSFTVWQITERGTKNLANESNIRVTWNHKFQRLNTFKRIYIQIYYYLSDKIHKRADIQLCMEFIKMN